MKSLATPPETPDKTPQPTIKLGDIWRRKKDILSRQQLEAINLLGKGMPQIEVAKKLGVTARTLQRWAKQTDFQAAMTKIRAQAFDQVIEATVKDIRDEVALLVPKALSVIEEALSNPAIAPQHRIRAADIVGKWAGLQQPQAAPETNAESILKQYLAALGSDRAEHPG